MKLGDGESLLGASFIPGAGMLCSSLRYRGEELLAQNAGVSAYAEQGKTMGIPLLYPWANRLAAFDYSVAGRTVEVPHDPTRIALDPHGLPIHGVIGGRMGWELTRRPQAGEHALTARLRWRESEQALFEVFPFEHELLYDARVLDERIELRVTVNACGADAVPLAFGFHPYLSLPGTPREQWSIELPAMRAIVLDDDQIPVGAGAEQAAQRFALDEREFDDGFDSLLTPARFALAGTDRRIVVDFLEGYPGAQVFTPARAQFICFEPMTAPTNALRSGEGLRTVPAGESRSARFSISVTPTGARESAHYAGPKHSDDRKDTA